MSRTGALVARLRRRVTTEHLVIIVGLKRSGLHGLTTWLVAHQPRHAVVNNSPQKRPGPGSGMSRTVRTSPLPKTVQPGTAIATVHDNVERTSTLPRSLDLLVVLFQSQDLDHLRDHQPIVTGVDAERTSTLLLLRDPFNWAASYMERSKNDADPGTWPEMWLQYADEFERRECLPHARGVDYTQWFRSQSYHADLARWLGYTPTDAGLQIVTKHADGSSFDLRSFDGRAQDMDVLGRWRHYANDERLLGPLRQHPELTRKALELFELPADLASFAHSVLERRKP